MSSSPKRGRPAKRSPKKKSVCSGLLKANCVDKDMCRWIKKYNLKGHEVPSACRKVRSKSPKSKRSKSPKRAKSPKRSKSPNKRRGRPRKNSPKKLSVCRKVPLMRDCRVKSGCSWVQEHAGRGGKVIPSLCRVARKKVVKKRVMSAMVKRSRKVSPKRRYSA